jgi:hypothetical protein
VKGRGSLQTVLAASELFADFFESSLRMGFTAKSGTVYAEKCSRLLAGSCEVTGDKNCCGSVEFMVPPKADLNL